MDEDLAYLKPTVFVSVPRIYNKFYAKMKSKLPEIPDDKIGCMKEVLGGKVRQMLTAAAPMSLDVREYIRRAIGAPFYECYG